jgi:allantoinase
VAKHRSRAEFSAIVNRPPLRLPDGKNVAVWVVLNVETRPIDQPMARAVLPPPQGVQVIPDVPNYSWFEYGLHIGFWRIKEVLDRHGVQATVNLTAPCATSTRRSSGTWSRPAGRSSGVATTSAC